MKHLQAFFIEGSYVFIAWVMGLLVFCCTHGAVAMTSKAEVRIGWIGPLTGPAAVLGTDALESIRMALDRINAEDVDRPRLDD